LPRASAEGRAAATYRAGAKRPASPEWLTEEAAEHWRGIVASKPLGWFDAGSLPLLAQYCEGLVLARQLAVTLANTDPTEKGRQALEVRFMGLNGSCLALATKLRLSVQSAVDRKSRMLDESGPGEAAAADPLLGGKVVRLRG
jgi:hypothetical protein